MLEKIKWRLIGFLGSLITKILFATIKKKSTGGNNLYTARDNDNKNVIYALWHGRLLGSMFTNRNQDICVMVSRHRDGEIIARIIEHLGYRTARGSDTRGGAAALKEMLRSLRAGHDLALTVDGPRGPRGVVKPGVIYAAARTGCQIVPVTCGYSKKKIFGSWDGFQLPVPLCKMSYVCGEPIHVPQSPTPEEVEALSSQLADSLNRISRLSDNLSAPVEYRESKLNVAVREFVTRRKTSLIQWPLLALCLPLEFLYRLGWFVRESLYTANILHREKPDLPIICAGSLFAGGSGKTPVAELIIERLLKQGLRVCLITRGYGRNELKSTVLPAASEPGPDFQSIPDSPAGLAEYIGDEAATIRLVHPELAVVAGPDRLESARIAAESLKAEVLVMDDGFGHRRLARDLDLLVFKENQLAMQTHCLPAGYLREPVAAASRAQAVAVIGKVPEKLPGWLQGLQLHQFERISLGFIPLKDWLDGERIGGKSIADKKVLAFCAIAAPESFREYLAGHSPASIRLIAFDDHHRYDLIEQRNLAKISRDNDLIIVTTEKDAVKLNPQLIGSSALVACQKVEPADSSAFDHLLDRLIDI